MPSNFEGDNIVFCATDWGRWYQTIDEIHIQVKLPNKVSAKEVKVAVSTDNINCSIRQNTIIEGKLFRPVHADETVWTLEDDGTLLNIVLSKADYAGKEIHWKALLVDQYTADPMTLQEMRKKLDLEKFQLEYPGMDFSNAKLSKSQSPDDIVN